MAFMEFLVSNRALFSSVANHISAVKAMLGLHGFSLSIFQSPKIKLFLRSLQLNCPLAISLPAVIDVHMLQRIVQVCDTMYMGQIYKAIYLLAFFSFLRL